LDVKTLEEYVRAIAPRHRRPELGAAARERVKDCTPARLSSQLLQLYGQLLGQ